VINHFPANASLHLHTLAAITVQYEVTNSVRSQAGGGQNTPGTWAGLLEPSVMRGWMHISEGGDCTTRDGLAGIEQTLCDDFLNE